MSGIAVRPVSVGFFQEEEDVSTPAPAPLVQQDPIKVDGLPPLLDIRTSHQAVDFDEVAAIVRPLASRSDLLSDEWGWQELRDYVVGQIESRWGARPRDPNKESGIFKGFITRWGAQNARRIAEVAFTVHGGQWRGAPISIERFCKGSDEYFAAVIMRNIAAQPAA